MHATMNSETRCVLELGSWLGKSTRFIVERAPNAYIFAVRCHKRRLSGSFVVC